MAPKAEIKQEKKDKVNALQAIMEGAHGIVFVNYSGMGVGVLGDLRKKLRETGGEMIVAKNTLIKLAARGAGLPEQSYADEVLSGQTGIVYSQEDAVSSIQALGKFASETQMPKIKAGIVEGDFQDSQGIIKISKLPGRDELYGQVVGSVASPMYGLVGTLQGNLQKLVFVLSQYKQKQA